MNITFVTSMFHLQNTANDATANSEKKSISWRIDRFKEIAGTGIHLCIYVCPVYNRELQPILHEFPNTKIVKVLEIKDTWIHSICEQYNDSPEILYRQYSLPAVRNEHKDTIDYMKVNYSKVEFVADTIRRNPWSTTYFAWIDFSISYIFPEKSKKNTLDFLRRIGTFRLSQEQQTTIPIIRGIAIPGCWGKFDGQHIGHITECVYWRFCGGFFLGDSESLLEFDAAYREHFPVFLETYGKLSWEVNFWAYLETLPDLKFRMEWFKADHNDTILTHLPAKYMVANLSTTASYREYKYEYPAIPGFHPSSASFGYNTQAVLNSRYVNYILNDEGRYIFEDETRIIRSKNVCSLLIFQENSGGNAGTYVPFQYLEMLESGSIELKEYPHYSRNLEDMRLYVHNGKLRFIATTVGYYHTGGNRMVVGNYCVDTGTYSDARIVDSPTGAWCEKNWAPIPTNDGDGNETFVYRWSPFEIGVLRSIKDNENLELEIVGRYDTAHIPYFDRLKGSSGFLEYGGQLVGVAHFSEDSVSVGCRLYFHMLVFLDKETFRPVKYSRPFIFRKIGIEFCIGFEIRENRYWFWISQMDREPVLVSLDIESLSSLGENTEILYADNV
jgi:hypothetical protein